MSVRDATPFEDKKAMEDVACYIVRAPLSLKNLVCLDGQKVAELGAGHQQGVPGGPPRLQTLRGSAQDRGVPTRELVRVPVDDEGREIQAG